MLDFLTPEGLSFTVIIGLNILAAVLVWAEYSNNRAAYLRNLAVGQTFILLWFVVGLVVTFYASNAFVSVLSSITVFIAGLYFLAASMYDKAPGVTWLASICVAYALILAFGGLIPLPVTDYSWYLIFLLFLALPAATLVCFDLKSRWLIALLQLCIAITLIFSITLLRSAAYAAVGAFLYFVVAILIPLLSISYIIISVRLSRLELATKERDYRVFFDSVEEVFYRSDKQGNIISVSPSIGQFGVTVDQIVDSNLAGYLTDSGSFQQSMDRALATMTPFEYRGSFKTSTRETDCEIISTPILNQVNGDYYFAGTIRNTHERNLLEKQFINAQRYESLGLMAGGVAHDFNNILQGIIGHAEILYDTQDGPIEDQKRHIGAILNAAESAGNLCQQLRLYTGKDLEEEKNFDLGGTIREVVEILRPAHSADIEVGLTIPRAPSLIHGAKSQVSQIFLNLIKNAMDAVGDKGEISVVLDEQYIGSESVPDFEIPAEVSEGKYFSVTVEDSGPGIDSHFHEKIFEPFYSTKQKGRGLGLAAISGILMAHKGAISVSSEPGKGARFRVILPGLTEGKIEESESRDIAQIPGIRILLAEDEEAIRDVASTMLNKAGHQVALAKDGIQALRVFEESEEGFDLLLTDVRMPAMDGLTLARCLIGIMPTLPVILATGYADISAELTREESLRFEFIHKPYRAAELMSAIEGAFNRLKKLPANHETSGV